MKIAVLASLLLGLTLVSACDGETSPVAKTSVASPPDVSLSDTPTPPSIEPLLSEITPVIMDSRSWLENIMKLIPDTEDTREITWVENLLPWWEYNEAHGLPRPSENDSDWVFLDYFVKSYELNPSSSLLRMSSSPRAFIPWLSGFNPKWLDRIRTRSTMGFDQRNVDSMFVAGQIMKGDRTLNGIVGSYDTEVTNSKLLACEECVQPDVIEYQGSEFYSWGEDYQGDLKRRFALPAFDNLGRGGRISVFPGYVLRTQRTEGMENLIDTVTGNSPSLWDSSEVRLVVEAMDELGLFTGIYSETDLSVETVVSLLAAPRGTEDAAVIRERMTTQPVLLPFLAVGSGYGIDSIDQPTHGVIVILHADSESAAENKLRLKELLRSGISPKDGQPWAELVGKSEIEVRGSLLLARLEPHPEADGRFNPIQLPELGPLVVTE